MDIIVCAKAIPGFIQNPRVSESRDRVEYEPGSIVINESDDYALEAAVKLAPDEARIQMVHALALWENGRQKEAISHQEQAVALATKQREREELEKTLSNYREAAGK